MTDHPYFKNPRRLWLLALLALFGFGMSAYLTQHYFEIHNGSAGFGSICNLGKAMNCDVVTASRYAELFLGIPLASVTAGWYLALFLITLYARNPFWRRECVRAALILTATGTVIGLGYFAIMAFALKTYCLFCLLIDGVNLGTLAIVFSLKPESFSKHPPEKDKWRLLITVTGACVIVSVLGLRILDPAVSPPRSMPSIEDQAQTVLGTPAVAINDSGAFPILGNPQAPITIVEFSDFQCPFCRIGAFKINSVLQKYPGQVRVVFRNYPLDPSCNRNMQSAGHAFACDAARVAYCAHQQGKFEPIYETFFENQSKFAPGKAFEMAVAQGVDAARLRVCVDAPETTDAIIRDVEEGTRLGVTSTPTLFVNGHKVEGAPPLPAWDIILQALKK